MLAESQESKMQIGNLLQSAAMQRWLSAEEVFIILSSDPDHIGLYVSTNSPVNPQGSLSKFFSSYFSFFIQVYAINPFEYYYRRTHLFIH